MNTYKVKVKIEASEWMDAETEEKAEELFTEILLDRLSDFDYDIFTISTEEEQPK